MTERPADPWPHGVHPIGIEDLGRLGINVNDELFWDGRRVEIRRALVLTRLQKILAVIVSLCAVLGGLGGFVTGINNASVFLCARNVDWLGCPPPVSPATPFPMPPTAPGSAPSR